MNRKLILLLVFSFFSFGATNEIVKKPEQPRFYLFSFFQFDGDINDIIRACGYSVDQYGDLVDPSGVSKPNAELTVPRSVAEKYLYPKSDEKLWLFRDSALVGVTKIDHCKIISNQITGDFSPVFEVEPIRIQKGSKTHLKQSVYVSVPTGTQSEQLPKELKLQPVIDEEISNVLKSIKKGKVETFLEPTGQSVSPDVDKPMPTTTADYGNLKPLESQNFPMEKVELVNFELAPDSGASMSYREKILACKVGQKLFMAHNCYFDQVFQVMGQDYVVLAFTMTGETGGIGEGVYRVDQDGLTLISRAGMGDN